MLYCILYYTILYNILLLLLYIILLLLYYMLYIIYYYTLHIYYYYIISYTILSSSSDLLFHSPPLPQSIPSIFCSPLLFCSFFYSLPSSFPLPSFPSSFLLSFPTSFKVYVSAFTYTYLYSIPIFQLLTPHVLSEWMVEVCRF